MYSSQLNTKNELYLLALSILIIGKKKLRYNTNTDFGGNQSFLKDFMLSLVRRKSSSYIRDAFLKAKISPQRYSSFEDIKRKSIYIRFPDGSEQKMSFATYYSTYTKDLPKIPNFHKDGSEFTEQQKSESIARKAIIIGIGNCNENQDLCKQIFMEMDAAICNAFKLNTIFLARPIMEQVEYKKELGDHCFNIINRPPDSDLNDIKSWVKNGDEVIILDLWRNRDVPLSVNEELGLAEAFRSPSFTSLTKALDQGMILNVISTCTLGEGHSKRWTDKGRNKYYFLGNKISLALESENACNNTQIQNAELEVDKSNIFSDETCENAQKKIRIR
jgi:hypothetical protein